jgi:hypothetical protein
VRAVVEVMEGADGGSGVLTRAGGRWTWTGEVGGERRDWCGRVCSAAHAGVE